MYFVSLSFPLYLFVYSMMDMVVLSVYYVTNEKSIYLWADIYWMGMYAFHVSLSFVEMCHVG